MKKILLTVAAVALLLSTSARAEVITKGGASALSNSPRISAGTSAKAGMDCPMCKSEFGKVSTPSFKGTAPATVTVERHGCASCATKFVTTGHGKMKTETAVHTCGCC